MIKACDDNCEAHGARASTNNHPSQCRLIACAGWLITGQPTRSSTTWVAFIDSPTFDDGWLFVDVGTDTLQKSFTICYNRIDCGLHIKTAQVSDELLPCYTEVKHA